MEYYTVKDLQETFTDRVKKRIDRLAPLHATRMGPAIRHTAYKLNQVDAKTKILFLISVLDVFLNSFFRLNLTGFLPGFLSFLLPLILGFIGLFFIRIELSGIKQLDLLNKKGEVIASPFCLNVS